PEEEAVAGGGEEDEVGAARVVQVRGDPRPGRGNLVAAPLPGAVGETCPAPACPAGGARASTGAARPAGRTAVAVEVARDRLADGAGGEVGEGLGAHRGERPGPGVQVELRGAGTTAC